MSKEFKEHVSSAVSAIVQGVYAKHMEDVMLGRKRRFDVVGFATEVGELLAANMDESYEMAANGIVHDLCKELLGVDANTQMKARLRAELEKCAGAQEYEPRKAYGTFVRRVESHRGGT